MSTGTTPAQTTLAGIHQVSTDVAIMFCGEEDLPPTVRATLPGGWVATGEVLDFDVKGEWCEGWILTR